MPLNVLTIATGKKLYADMAVNLARSFWLWNANNAIDFYIATDQAHFLPNDVKIYSKIIKLQPAEFGLGFSPKLHLDKIAPEGQTLFIDSDCLVYGSILPVFEKFKGHDVSVVGNYISGGDWFGDIGNICKQFGIGHLPRFNGGIYYLEKGETVNKIYNEARSLEKKYDKIGFVRLRNRPNDEVIMAVAMQLNQQQPIPDDGSILGEFVNFQSGIKSDLLNGFAELYNDPADAHYQENWHLTVSRPLIVHFLGHHNQIMPYVKEVKLLTYLFANKWPLSIAAFVTSIGVTVPQTIVSWLRNTLRPLYRRMFGIRMAKPSERIIND